MRNALILATVLVGVGGLRLTPPPGTPPISGNCTPLDGYPGAFACTGAIVSESTRNNDGPPLRGVVVPPIASQ